ncbi:MAG: 4-hydroxy-tetrahydrodipicolinate synthase [Myxococcales bacterium]|jgi:4-hydroxy-tetrahydrodipicolinate synthase|nr:4-hydroxy-tetrahydrodipicolinate synthase [Myxococcales bacterium]
MVDVTLRGTFTALVTPFTSDHAVDHAAFERVLEAQVASGVNGLVPCGTTGESPTLTEAEQLELVTRCVAAAKPTRGGVRVVAGTGSFSTKKTIDASVAAERAGADAVMVVVPYYSKPTQEGLFQHFVAVARAVSCPVVVYNIPGRTGIDLAADTLLRIMEVAPNVTATKEATGNVLRAQELVRRSEGRLTVLSGDDGLTFPMAALGAQGVISVTSNLLPGHVSRATRLALEAFAGAGDVAGARAAHFALLPVHDAMFVEANPGPVKAAMARAGLLAEAVRAPLAPISEAARARVLEAVAAFTARAGADPRAS